MAVRQEEAGLIAEAFERIEESGAILRVRRDLLGAALAAGLQDPAGWESRLDRPSDGRGRTGTVRLGPEGPVARLKRLHRGGLAGPLWGGRFFGGGRVFANLEVAAVAVARGVPTPEPLALLAVPGPPGFWRGWLATADLDDALPIERRLLGSNAAPVARRAMRVVREMHDAGIEHRDLNLGNLLVKEGTRGLEVFVLDLDGARVHAGPLAFALRQRALRRLERSTVKRLGAGSGEIWYAAYADDDAGLAARLSAGRVMGRWLVSLHRSGWKG